MPNKSALLTITKRLGSVIAALCLVFLLDTIYQNWETIASIERLLTTPKNLTLIFILYFLGFGTFTYAWKLQINAKHADFTFLNAYKIIGLSQIAKYLPGNVGHYLGRIALSPPDIRKTDIGYSLVIEAVAMTASTATLGFVYLAIYGLPSFWDENDIYPFGICAILIISTTIACLYFLRRKFELLHIRIHTAIAILCLCFLSAVSGGLTIYILAEAVLPSSPNILLCISGFSLSFLIGFITPGAPGGAGVREASFVALFASTLGTAESLQIILAFRFLSILGDILLFLSAYAIKQLQPR